MIKINALGSSSNGNSIILSDGITTILLDAGLPVKEMEHKLWRLKTNGVFKDIDGVLITHEHQDHIQGISSIGTYEKYMTKGTFDGAKIKHIKDIKQVKIIEKNKQFKIGTFIIKPFGVLHDAGDPVGYLIKNVSGEKIVYMTDTGIANTLVKNADVYIIESNHISKEAVLATGNDPNKRMSIELAERIVKSHLSEDQTLEYLEKCIGDKTKQIILMHISPNHPNPTQMMSRFRKKLDTDIVNYIHPTDHKILKQWTVGYQPERKRSF